MTTVECIAIGGFSFLIAAAVAIKAGDPVGWWLFRLAHRDNLEALAFADRKQRRV